MVFIPYTPPTTYLSLILKQLGYSSLKANLLAIPQQFFFAINMIPYAWLSARFNERSFMASLSNFWNLAFLIPLYLLKESQTSYYNWVRYGLITALTSVPYCTLSKSISNPLLILALTLTILVLPTPTLLTTLGHPFLIGWVSQNSQSVRNRAVSLCLYNMSVQVGNILATRIYTNGDKPYYRKGNLALIFLAVLSIVLCWLVKLYYIQRNKQKTRAWEKLSPDEQLQYKLTTKDEGSKRLDALFVH